MEIIATALCVKP